MWMNGWKIDDDDDPEPSAQVARPTDGRAGIHIRCCDTVIDVHPVGDGSHQRYVVNAGWSGLDRCTFEDGVTLDTTERIKAAINGSLTLYGKKPELTLFRHLTKNHIRKIVGYALDNIIVKSDEFELITIHDPEFLQGDIEAAVSLSPDLVVQKSKAS